MRYTVWVYAKNKGRTTVYEDYMYFIQKSRQPVMTGSLIV